MKTARIIFSDVNLTNKKVNHSMRRILEDSLSELGKELTSIGYCELGHAVITRGASKEVSHNIFVPVVNSQNPEDKMNSYLFHKAVRSAFTLAKLYKIKDLIVELPSWYEEKTMYNIEFLGFLLKKVIKPPLDKKDIKSIIDSVLKDYTGILVKIEHLP